MHIGWFIGLSASSIIFFVSFFILSRANYKRRFGTTYDFRNHFPYELNYEAPFSINLLGNIALVMACSFSVGFFALTSAEIRNNGFIIYSLISGVLYSIFIGAINFIPLKTIRLHLIFSILLFAAAFATPCAIGLGAFNVYQGTKEPFPLVVMIISLVIGLFHFVLIMNPKLTFNIKMQVATDEKGNTTYIRPKFILMSFTEWILMFDMALTQLMLILYMIVIMQ